MHINSIGKIKYKFKKNDECRMKIETIYGNFRIIVTYIGIAV